MSSTNNLLVFSGTSHVKFAEEIASELGVSLGKVLIEKFPDEEIGVQILENVRGRDVFVVQTIAHKPNFYLMELLILVDALKRASARSITAVIPYFGYSRQDRKDKGRVPITAKLVANLLETAGVTRVLTMDLHAAQIQGFFDIPLDNLFARKVLAEEVKKDFSNSVVVTPDIGSIRLARQMSHELGADIAIVDKKRVHSKQVETGALIGSVEGKNVLLVDDICSSGATLKAAASLCKKKGAKSVKAAVTHGLFKSDLFHDSKLDQVITTNTIPLEKSFEKSSLIKQVTVAPLFARAMRSIVENTSIASLYQ